MFCGSGVHHARADIAEGNTILQILGIHFSETDSELRDCEAHLCCLKSPHHSSGVVDLMSSPVPATLSVPMSSNTSGVETTTAVSIEEQPTHHGPGFWELSMVLHTV